MSGICLNSETRIRRAKWLHQSASAVIVLASILPFPAAAQTSAATQTSPTSGEQDDAAEQPAGQEVVVTGIRASIERAARIQRNATEVVDAISSEDLGKLPDTNVAEGLQRVTGVQIQRDGGEGNDFQIRGASQNLTLINGREVAPDAGLGSSPEAIRQVNLFNYPSELFRDVVVYKSRGASLIEGGVGGTVDLRMPDPLATPARVVMSLQGGRLSLQNTPVIGASFLATQRDFNDRLGIVLGATYYKRRVTTDAYSSSNYTALQTLDVTGDGRADPNVVIPFNMTYNRQNNVRKRLSANALIAWEPSDNFRGYLDASYVKQTNDRRRNFIAFNFSTARTVPTAAAAVTQTEDDGSITVLSGTYSNVNNTVDALNQGDIRNLFSTAVGGTWKATDRLAVSFDLGRSWSKVNQYANVYQTQQKTRVIAEFDITTEIPEVHVVNGGDITDPNAFNIAVVNARHTAYEPEILQGRVDVAYELDGFVKKVLVGARATRSEFGALFLNNRYANTYPIGTNIPATRFPEYLDLRTLDNFFGGASGNFPTEFIVTSVPGTPEAGLVLLNKFGDPGPLRAIPESNYDILERTRAGYVQLDFGAPVLGRDLTGNVGVRYVVTKLASGSSVVGNNGTVSPIEYHNDYVDWLPSLNLRWEVARNLIARASAGKVMARPSISALSAGTNVSFGIGGLNTATSGQPLLKPFRATQYDLGLAYYFPSGGFVSGAAFYKDIKSYVLTRTSADVVLPGFPGQTFQLSAPSNGPGGRTFGFETGVQRSFGFITDYLKSFGMIANFTYVNSRRKGSDLQIEDTSKYSANLIGYFERGPFQTRVAYNWRGQRYLGVSRGFDIYADPRGQLDASASYDVTKNLTVTVEASNILETPSTNYSQFESRRDSYQVNDRSLIFGIRATL